MNLHIFPAKFVYWKKIKNYKEIKNEYYPKILDNLSKNKNKLNKNVKSNWDCDCYSSFFENNSSNRSIFDDKFIDQVIWKSFDKMLMELGNSILKFPTPKYSNVTEIWYNYYVKGMFQEVHKHYNNRSKNDFSGIYLMHLEEPNTTAFADSGLHIFNTNHIEEGSIIIFPSDLMHYVKPCKRDRITVSFNISSEY